MADLLPAVGFPLLYAAPWLIILIVAFVLFLTRRRRLPARVARLGMTACVLLALSSLGSVASNVFLVTAAARGSDFDESASVVGLVNVVFMLVGAVGLALLVAAALAGRMISPGVGAPPWPGAYAPPPGPAWPPAGSPPTGQPPPGWSPYGPPQAGGRPPAGPVRQDGPPPRG